ncbi:MAG: type II toxin-antitoxin system HicB family antitoxin [Tepidiformaceae bacterium]
MKFPVTMYRDEDGVFTVDCPSVPGCMSQGQTEAEALENIKDAIRLCLEVRREDGLPPTVALEAYEVDVAISA